MVRVKTSQFTERAVSIRPSSYLFSRLRLLVCILALVASFISLVYPVLVGKNVEIILPVDHHAIDRGYDSWGIQNESSDPNKTLLVYAAIDLNEKGEKMKISMLLEGKKGVLVTSRNIMRYQRAMNYTDRGRNAVMPTWMFQVQSPKYDLYWPRFRQLLQAWARKSRHEPLVMGELFGNVKTTLDNFYSVQANPQGPIANDENSERYRTCAVVGNSGMLLRNGSRFGSLIDNHDVVIRLNNAKVKGFEAYVGSKTSVSFVNSNVYQACSLKQNCFCHPYGNIPVILYLCQVQHLMDIAFCERHYDSPVVVTDLLFDALCTRLIKWYSMKSYVEVTGNPIRNWAKNHSGADFHYSSGLQAVVLALGICEKVDMFGFGKSSQAPHHYHTNRKAELSLHDYLAEYRFYEDLARNRTSSIPFLAEAGMRLPQFSMYL